MTVFKKFYFLPLAATLALSMSSIVMADDALAPAVEEAAVIAAPPIEYRLESGFAGRYLSSHFAQSNDDWSSANIFLNDILKKDPHNLELIRRSMILATGSGDMETAKQRAADLLVMEPGDSLALMILAVNAMAANNMDKVREYAAQMETGDMTEFVSPILKNWASAAEGKFDTTGFNETIIHNYHGGMIAIFLNKPEEVDNYITAMLSVGALSNTDAERTADLLSIAGRFEEAKKLYEGIFVQDPNNQRLAAKVAAISKENGGNIKELAEPMKIKRAQEGAALAMYDMAYILYQEHSDSSTKLFAQMALALDPNMSDARLLLSDTLSRNGRFEEAIEQLANIPQDHPSYLDVQRHAAELLSEAGYHDEALERLNRLFIDHNDVEALIRIGDLHRHEENFSNALTAYNKAAGQIGKTIPEEYWYLLYARGMAYEREGNWSKAESDLKAALVYRPDHPYLLNYLGYGWADQGLNLDESLELIKRAVALRPHDGYIIDSLGWAQYMMGDYEGALPNLERAVELLPYDSTINDHLGDVYWRVGRRTEARFQWERALNYGEEQALADKLRDKLKYGLEATEPVKQAGTK